MLKKFAIILSVLWTLILIAAPACAQMSSTEKNIEAYKDNPYVKPHPIYVRMAVGTHWQITKVGEQSIPLGSHGFSIEDDLRITLFDGCSNFVGSLGLPQSVSRDQSLRPDYEKPHVNIGRFQIYESGVFQQKDCQTPEAKILKQAYDRILKDPLRFSLAGDHVQAQKMTGSMAMGPRLAPPTASGPVITLHQVIPGKLDFYENRSFIEDPATPLQRWITVKKGPWGGGDIRGADGCNPIGAYYRPTATGLHMVDAGVIPSSDGCANEPLDRTLTYQFTDDEMIWTVSDAEPAAQLNKVDLDPVDPSRSLFTPGSHWRLSSFNDKPIPSAGSHGIRIGEDHRVVIANGCFAQQAAIWFGNDKTAITPNGIAADGMNRFTAFNQRCGNLAQLPDSLKPYQDFLNKAWRVSMKDGEVYLTFVGADGTQHKAHLSRDKIGRLNSLVGKTLKLVKASNVNRRLSRLKNPPKISFTDKILGGNDGCNNFGGAYRFVNGRIKPEEIMSTAMGCGKNGSIPEALNRILHPDAVLEFDGTYVTAKVENRMSKYQISKTE